MINRIRLTDNRGLLLCMCADDIRTYYSHGLGYERGSVIITNDQRGMYVVRETVAELEALLEAAELVRA